MHTPRICRGALRGLDPSGRSPDSGLGTVGSAGRAPSADTGWFPLVCGGMSDTCEQLAQINGDTGSVETSRLKQLCRLCQRLPKSPETESP